MIFFELFEMASTKKGSVQQRKRQRKKREQGMVKIDVELERLLDDDRDELSTAVGRNLHKLELMGGLLAAFDFAIEHGFFESAAFARVCNRILHSDTSTAARGAERKGRSKGEVICGRTYAGPNLRALKAFQFEYRAKLPKTPSRVECSLKDLVRVLHAAFRFALPLRFLSSDQFRSWAHPHPSPPLPAREPAPLEPPTRQSRVAGVRNSDAGNRTGEAHRALDPTPVSDEHPQHSDVAESDLSSNSDLGSDSDAQVSPSRVLVGGGSVVEAKSSRVSGGTRCRPGQSVCPPNMEVAVPTAAPLRKYKEVEVDPEVKVRIDETRALLSKAAGRHLSGWDVVRLLAWAFEYGASRGLFASPEFQEAKASAEGQKRDGRRGVGKGKHVSARKKRIYLGVGWARVDLEHVQRKYRHHLPIRSPSGLRKPLGAPGSVCPWRHLVPILLDSLPFATRHHFLASSEFRQLVAAAGAPSVPAPASSKSARLAPSTSSQHPAALHAAPEGRALKRPKLEPGLRELQTPALAATQEAHLRSSRGSEGKQAAHNLAVSTRDPLSRHPAPPATPARPPAAAVGTVTGSMHRGAAAAPTTPLKYRPLPASEPSVRPTSTAPRKRPLETSQHHRQPPTAAQQSSSSAARRSLFPLRTPALPASEDVVREPWAAQHREQDVMHKIHAIPICRRYVGGRCKMPGCDCARYCTPPPPNDALDRLAVCSRCAHHFAFHRCCQESPLPPHLLPRANPLLADDEAEPRVTAADMMEDYFEELERRILAHVGPNAASVAASEPKLCERTTAADTVFRKGGWEGAVDAGPTGPEGNECPGRA